MAGRSGDTAALSTKGDAKCEGGRRAPACLWIRVCAAARSSEAPAGCFSSTKRGDVSICDLKLSPCIKAKKCRLCGSKQSGGSGKESEADSFSEGRKEARQQQSHHSI